MDAFGIRAIHPRPERRGFSRSPVIFQWLCSTSIFVIRHDQGCNGQYRKNKWGIQLNTVMLVFQNGIKHAESPACLAKGWD